MEDTRRTAVSYPNKLTSVVPADPYCYVYTCSLCGLFRCEICKKHICFNHKYGRTNEFLVCAECYFHPLYTDIININQTYFKNKNKRNKYFQKFIDIISFEWVCNKV